MTYKGVFQKLEDTGVIHGHAKPYVHQSYPKMLYFEDEHGKEYSLIVNNSREELAANSEKASLGHSQVSKVAKDPLQDELDAAQKSLAEANALVAKQAKELAEAKAKGMIGSPEPKKTEKPETKEEKPKAKDPQETPKSKDSELDLKL